MVIRAYSPTVLMNLHSFVDFEIGYRQRLALYRNVKFDNHKAVAPFCTDHQSGPGGTSDRAGCAFCGSRELARIGDKAV